MTFSALNVLITLGDDLSRLNRDALLDDLARLQLDDGSFTATNQDFENDVRFLYSVCCICHYLNDWSRIDVKRACKYLLECLVNYIFFCLHKLIRNLDNNNNNNNNLITAHKIKNFKDLRGSVRPKSAVRSSWYEKQSAKQYNRIFVIINNEEKIN